jgi:hypothetical protein
MCTSVFILNETDINAATGSPPTFEPTWNQAPSSVTYESVFLQDVNQTTLMGASAGNTTTSGDSISTSAPATNNGDLVIATATCSKTGTYTVNNSFTEALEPSITDVSAVDGYKSAEGANEIPSVTHSTADGRQSLVGFVVQGSMQ